MVFEFTVPPGTGEEAARNAFEQEIRKTGINTGARAGHLMAPAVSTVWGSINLCHSSDCRLRVGGPDVPYLVETTCGVLFRRSTGNGPSIIGGRS